MRLGMSVILSEAASKLYFKYLSVSNTNTEASQILELIALLCECLNLFHETWYEKKLCEAISAAHLTNKHFPEIAAAKILNANPYD
jgi:hypothetical protein